MFLYSFCFFITWCLIIMFLCSSCFYLICCLAIMSLPSPCILNSSVSSCVHILPCHYVRQSCCLPLYLFLFMRCEYRPVVISVRLAYVRDLFLCKFVCMTVACIKYVTTHLKLCQSWSIISFHLFFLKHTFTHNHNINFEIWVESSQKQEITLQCS